MSTEFIARCLTAGLLIWFVLLVVLIAGRILRGDLDTTGLLRAARPDADVLPERALSMSLFPLVIVSYAYTALHADVNVSHPSLPDLPDNLLMLLAGGNGIYLAGKIARPR
jgi:hypothetical protein